MVSNLAARRQPMRRGSLIEPPRCCKKAATSSLPVFAPMDLKMFIGLSEIGFACLANGCLRGMVEYLSFVPPMVRKHLLVF